MEVFEAIRKRRSIRKYSNKDVEWEKIGEILKAGKEAPSAGNLQNYKFILVWDKGKRKAIAEACLQQYWMEQAPVHILICSEPEHGKKFYGVRGERLYSIQNCAAVAQNMLLRATDLGLGSCWVGAFEEEMLKRALSVAPFARPQIVITLGYPAEEVPPPLKHTLEHVVFFQRWGTRIKDMDMTMGWFGSYFKKRIHEGKQFLSEQVDEKKKKFVDGLKKKLSKDSKKK